MELLKAMVLGLILTGCVSVVIGSQGSTGGQLAIHSLMVADFKVYWSWPMFFASTGLCWGLILLQR